MRKRTIGLIAVDHFKSTFTIGDVHNEDLRLVLHFDVCPDDECADAPNWKRYVLSCALYLDVLPFGELMPKWADTFLFAKCDALVGCLLPPQFGIDMEV